MVRLIQFLLLFALAVDGFAAPHAAHRRKAFRNVEDPAATSLADFIAYYQLDEESSARADESANNLDLTDVNGVGFGTGKVSNAADFVPASAEYFTYADDANFDTGGTSFTWAFWFKLDSFNTTGNWMVNKRGAASQLEFQIAVLNADDSLGFDIWVAGVVKSIKTAASSISAGTWYFCVARFDNDTDEIKLRLNETDITPVATGGATTSGTAALVIGQAWSGGAGLRHDGLIDEMGFWKRAITDAEATYLYNSGNARTYNSGTGKFQ